MADRNKFEEMLERLVNEDRAGAEELFHEIVVEKSRDIYEALLESDLEDDEVDEASDDDDDAVEESDDEEVDESEDDAELDEDFNLDEFEVEADPMADMMGGDKTDDMMGDMEMGSDDDSDDGEEGTDERINDLEDALEELKAEFEKMMSGDDSEEADDEMDMGDEEADDEMDMGDEEPEEESFQATITPLESKSPMTAGETMREYVEKVTAKMGDNGASTTSTVAKPNNMGGTSANIAKGGTADTKGTAGGLASNKPQVMNTKNVNVVGAKGATKMSSQPGHGAEKKGKPETAANTKSIVGK
jgi:hypothetical protein